MPENQTVLGVVRQHRRGWRLVGYAAILGFIAASITGSAPSCVILFWLTIAAFTPLSFANVTIRLEDIFISCLIMLMVFIVVILPVLKMD
ncbi:MAG TPA: hypothetical protein VGZ22_15215 [Isosphaeraceae bacterium]|nr:hypothetical protein [Isosphaeraceae bacterium]